MYETEVLDLGGGGGNSMICYVTQRGKNENVTFRQIGEGCQK